MKRFAILCSIIASFVLIPIKASGQITISNTEARDKIVALDPYNFCGIGIDENGYFLFSNTSNTFDNAFIMYLGDAKEGSLKTLKDLVALVEMTKSQHVTFQSWSGNSYTASTVYNGISLSTPDRAGDVYLHKSLLNWLINQMENPKGGPWNSVTEAFNAMGNSEKATSVVVGGQVRKWGESYYYSLSTGDVYLGSSREDAIETLREYESMASTKDQVWPVIILNSTSCARVTTVNELGAKTAYVNPLDGGQQMSLYQLYLKKHLKALEK